MEKTQFTSAQLSKGLMEVYDFGSVKLHAFKTNDLISDECFLVEKAGSCFMIADKTYKNENDCKCSIGNCCQCADFPACFAQI